jgi:hypothetical protein
MSNRYFNMGNINQHAMSHALLPRAGANSKDKTEEHIKDESAGAKRIEGNIHYRNQVQSMQQARNYHMERDRLHGLLAENRIPANRHIVRKRIKQLDEKISELDEDKK